MLRTLLLVARRETAQEACGATHTLFPLAPMLAAARVCGPKPFRIQKRSLNAINFFGTDDCRGLSSAEMTARTGQLIKPDGTSRPQESYSAAAFLYSVDGSLRPSEVREWGEIVGHLLRQWVQ